MESIADCASPEQLQNCLKGKTSSSISRSQCQLSLCETFWMIHLLNMLYISNWGSRHAGKACRPPGQVAHTVSTCVLLFLDCDESGVNSRDLLDDVPREPSGELLMKLHLHPQVMLVSATETSN